MRALRLLLIALPLLLASLPAAAHTEGHPGAGLVAGLLHPVTGLDHLVAMVAVGLWGAILGPPLVFALPIAFPLMMAFGGVLGVAGVPLPGVEIVIPVSAIALGGAVLANLRPPAVVAIALVGLFAVFHGHAHGAELPAAADATAFSLGFVISTGLLHLCGIGIGLLAIAVPGLGLNVVRACGGLVALAGLWFLAGALGAA